MEEDNSTNEKRLRHEHVDGGNPILGLMGPRSKVLGQRRKRDVKRQKIGSMRARNQEKNQKGSGKVDKGK